MNARRALQFAAFGGGGAHARRGHVIALSSFLAQRYDWAERVRSWLHEERPAGIVTALGYRAQARSALARFVRNYVLHAPGYAHLFYLRGKNRMRGYASLIYHRIVRRAFNLGKLIVRRTAGYARRAAWLALIWLPRKAWDFASLLYHRVIRRGVDYLALFARRGIGYARRAAWLALIWLPRKAWDHASLMYHRHIKLGLGYIQLGMHLAYGYSRVALWWLLIGIPRSISGRANVLRNSKD